MERYKLSTLLPEMKFLEEVKCIPADVSVIPYMQEISDLSSDQTEWQKIQEEEIQLLTDLPNIINSGNFFALKEAWEISSTFLISAYSRDVIERIFENIGYLSMEPQEQEFFSALPDTVKAYRAGEATGISWTLSSEIAELHAKNTGREIIQKYIPKNQIHAFYSGEKELIVFDRNSRAR